MARDPAFLFYPDDWAGGTKTFMKPQKSDYLDLLCIQHAHGYITRDDIIDICGSYDEKIARKFSIEFEPGHFQNERLRDEMVKRSKYSESRRRNRLAGFGNQKIDFGDQDKSSYDNHVLSHDEHMGNGNGNGNINNIKEKVSGKKSNSKSKKPKPEPRPIDVVYPWDSDLFAEAWNEWKLYKGEQHQFTYKPIGENNAIKSLFNEVGGDMHLAIAAIKNSMSRGWMGVIVTNELKMKHAKINRAKTGQSFDSGFGGNGPKPPEYYKNSKL
jgi:hypothetical protein